MCTEFILPDSNATISARTMDFSFAPEKIGASWSFATVPVGTKFNAIPFPNTGSTNFTSYSWEAQYPCFGIICNMLHPFEILNVDPLFSPPFVDIMNTHGLSAAALWLPATQYQEPVDVPVGAKFISSLDICSWVCTNYTTIEGLKCDLSLAIEGKPMLNGGFIPRFWDPAHGHIPLHFQIHDKFGYSLVLEFKEGKLIMTDNSDLGVMTNAPFLDWHRENLGNYCTTTNQDIDARTPRRFVKDKGVFATGHGGGLKVISSSALPSDRYLRSVFNLNNSLDYLKSLNWGTGDQTPKVVAHAMNLVRSIFVIRGQCLDAPTADKPNPTTGDYTQWEIIRDHRAGVWYMKTADSFGYWKVGFAQFQLEKPEDAKSFALTDMTETASLKLE